jgi:hypothetical protein
VHGVGADHQAVCAAAFQPADGGNHPLRQRIPLTRMLEGFDLSKVDGVQQAFSRMGAALACFDAQVDQAIIFEG